jgi:hypothetical protein
MVEEQSLKVSENKMLTTIFEATGGGGSNGRVEIVA